MTNSKNQAFLMCPTSRTTQLGGTPLESGEAGGHIKKASWVHVLDALPLALRLPCEITRFKMEQFVAGEAAANTCFMDALATIGSFGTEIAELGGGEGLGAHGLDLRCRWFLLVFTKPDRPQNLQLPDTFVGDVFPPLRDGALRDAEKVGQVFGPPGEVNSLLGLHAKYFSTLNV